MYQMLTCMLEMFDHADVCCYRHYTAALCEFQPPLPLQPLSPHWRPHRQRAVSSRCQCCWPLPARHKTIITDNRNHVRTQFTTYVTVDALARDLLQRIERRQQLICVIGDRRIVAGGAGQRHRCDSSVANGRSGAQDLRAHRRLVGGALWRRNAHLAAEAATAAGLIGAHTVRQLVLVEVHDRKFAGPIVQPIDNRRGQTLALVVAGQARREAATLCVRVHLRIQPGGERAAGQQRGRRGRLPVLVAAGRLEAENVAH